MVVWLENRAEGIERDVTSYPIFRDWSDQPSSFASLAAFSGVSATVLDGGDPELLTGAYVTADFFRTLGVAARLGRTLVPGDAEATSAPHVVLPGDHAAFGRTARTVTG